MTSIKQATNNKHKKKAKAKAEEEGVITFTSQYQYRRIQSVRTDHGVMRRIQGHHSRKRTQGHHIHVEWLIYMHALYACCLIRS